MGILTELPGSISKPGKTYKERLVPLHEEAAEAIRDLQRRKTGARGLRNEQTGQEVRYLFMSRGKLLSEDYLFADSLQKVCQMTGITASDGKALVMLAVNNFSTHGLIRAADCASPSSRSC